MASVFPSVNARNLYGMSADGIRLPSNIQVKKLRGINLFADKAIVNLSQTATVTATGAFIGAITARFSYNSDGDRVLFTMNPIASTLEAAAATITAAALVPVKFRPQTTKSFFVRGADNSVAATLLVTIATTGDVTVSVGAGAANFIGTGNLSMDACQGVYSLRE